MALSVELVGDELEHTRELLCGVMLQSESELLLRDDLLFFQKGEDEG